MTLPSWLMWGFREVVQDCHLSNITLEGHPYTWFHGRSVDNWVEQRLDRALVCSLWGNLYVKSRLHNLIAPVSNHSPILLDTDGLPYKPRCCRFRFENAWLLEEDVEEVVNGCRPVTHEIRLVSKIKKCGDTLEH